ncbi:MAG TPA: hypothetical protein VII66_09875 [Gemmatimonadaceae bacterium]
MTATDTEAMSALQELLDERQRYQGWLATLDGRRSSTPPHVYERVQQDYVGRLDRVMQSLAERAGQLAGTIQTMTAELATLRQHESDRTDERHEAELRAAVGEFTPDDWERRRVDADSDLERIAAERHSLSAELEELQRIVALTRSIKPENKASAPGDDTGGSVPRSSAREHGASTESTPSIEDFVAEWNPPQVRPLPGRAKENSASDRVPAPPATELEDLIIPSAPMGGNPVGAAGADYGMANGVTGVAAAAAATRSPQPTPAAFGDSRRDTDKTLKCPECAAMNYATEWYCERCGGELSTF